jgi:hypothetical protein
MGLGQRADETKKRSHRQDATENIKILDGFASEDLLSSPMIYIIAWHSLRFIGKIYLPGKQQEILNVYSPTQSQILEMSHVSEEKIKDVAKDLYRKRSLGQYQQPQG